jgi:hypothetical protein
VAHNGVVWETGVFKADRVEAVEEPTCRTSVRLAHAMDVIIDKEHPVISSHPSQQQA